MRNAILLLSILLCNYLCGQVMFDYTYGNDPHYCRDIEHANNGGFMLSVQTDWPWTNTELYRLNSAGDTLWTRNFGSDTVQFKTYEMINSSDGGYILCGDHQTLSTQPNMDSYIMKIDSLGHVEWFNQFGITYEDGGNKDYANNVVELGNYNYVIAGNAKHCFTDSSGYFNFGLFQGYIGLLDSIGDTLRLRSIVYCFQPDTQNWQRRFFPLDMAVVGGKIMVVSEQTNGWGPPFYSAGHAVIFNQNLDTVRSMDFPVNNIITATCASNDNNFLIAGDSLLAKVDTSGNILWQRNLGLPFRSFTELAQRPNGEIVILESANGWWMQSDVWANDASSAGGIVIMHTFDSNGYWICSDTISDQSMGIRGMADFVLSGDSIVTFGGGSGSPARAWILQYAGRCHQTVSTNNVSADINVVVYPNPCSDQLIIENAANIVSYSVYSISGQQLVRRDVSFSEQISIDVHELKEGYYLLGLKDAQGRVVQVSFTKH